MHRSPPLAAALLWVAAANALGPVPVAAAPVEAFFAPAPFTHQSVRAQIVRHIAAAHTSIDIAIFEFTAGEITRQLRAAAARGVHIRVVMDRGQVERDQRGSSEYRSLQRARIVVRLVSGLPRDGLMHNKFAIYDRRVVQTGSYNWTERAEKGNWENAVFIADPALARTFAAYFERLWDAGS